MKRKEKQRIRRFSALLLSLMLICAMSMTAFATDEGNTTTTTETESDKTAGVTTHSYTAYQIFTGKYFDGKLSNIDWGVSAQDKEIQDAIAQALGLSAGAPLADILAALGDVENETAAANQLAAAIASKADKLVAGKPVKDGDPVDPGYYIVIDTITGTGDGESRNFALLECIEGTISIKTKTGTVTSDKKVKDVNDSEYDPTDNAMGTSADYDIGDEVPFELTGTVADNFELFQDAYKFVFHDTESKGLSFNVNSVKVTIGGNTITSDHYEVVTGDDGRLEPGETFQIIFPNLKEVPGVQAGSEIKISYTSTLNEDAVIGAAGNDNTMYLEYSNNPYDGDETGKTPEKKVIVFTYKVEVNKVNGDPNPQPLEGAGFALYKVDNNYKDENGNIKDDGVLNADNSKQNVLNNKTYNKLVANYENTDGKMTTFSFEGIDDGEYLLVETKTPAGYNSIEPIAFTVTVDHSTGDLSLKGESVDPTTGEVLLAFTADENLGTLTRDVVNKSGSLLPSTGGIGTTMFYIIGGVLMVGACMMLFVRKIMTNEKR